MNNLDSFLSHKLLEMDNVIVSEMSESFAKSWNHILDKSPYPVEMLHLKRSNFIAKQNTTIILKLPSGMHHHGAHNHNLCAFAI